MTSWFLCCFRLKTTHQHELIERLSAPGPAWLGPTDWCDGEVSTDPSMRADIFTHLLDVDIMEEYSPERVAKLCENYGVTPVLSLDLTNGLDFDKAEDRLRGDSTTMQAHTVIGSPPCT